MAERRMFSKSVIGSDIFTDMPLSTQALYLHLGVQADDDGFVNNPKRIQRSIGAADDDLKLLAAKGFIIPFDSGVIVITHWKNHNYIQKDRYHPTIYCNEKQALEIDSTGAYYLDTKCIQNVSKMDTKVRIDKVRVDKDREDKRNLEKERINNTPCGAANTAEMNPAEPDFDFEIEMIVNYFLLTYKSVTGKEHEPISGKKMAEIQRRLKKYDAVKEYIDEYFYGSVSGGKPLCGDSDMSIFHFSDPGVLDLLGRRVHGTIMVDDV